MKNKTNAIWLALLIISTCVGCAPKKVATVSVASFYNLGVAYIRTDVGGNDYFNVYAKGGNEAECRQNAKMELMRIIALEGVNQGANLKPVLNMPPDVNKFKEMEYAFYAKYAGPNQVVDATGKIEQLNKIAQSENKTAGLSMRVQVSINLKLFEQQLKQFIKEK